MERKEEKLEESLEKGEEEKAEEIGKAKSFFKRDNTSTDFQGCED